MIITLKLDFHGEQVDVRSHDDKGHWNPRVTVNITDDVDGVVGNHITSLIPEPVCMDVMSEYDCKIIVTHGEDCSHHPTEQTCPLCE